MKVTALLFCLLFSLISTAQAKTYEFSFDLPQIAHGPEGLEVHIDGLPETIEPGMPIVPFRTIRILVPEGSEVTNASVNRQNTLNLGFAEGIALAPSLWRQAPVDSIETTRPYPMALSYESQQSKHGYRIWTGKIHPVWIDEENHLLASQKISVNLTFSKRVKSANDIAPNPLKKGDVQRLIDNPEDADIFVQAKASKESYDYLFVVTESLWNSQDRATLKRFSDFLNTSQGLKTKTISIQEILRSTSGRDGAEKLRNFLREEYSQHSLSYLLIVGDSAKYNSPIPVRSLYTEIMGYNGSWRLIKAHIPSDFYYSCLDGSFNSDGDEFWGEIGDGENGTDVDFMCELTVGRWPVDTSEQLEMVIDKTLAAYKAKNRPKKALLLGELLFREMDLWGKDYMNQLIGTSQDHGYTSVGFGPEWQVDSLYEKDRNWRSSDVKAKIRNGNYFIINHLGHSSSYMNMKLSIMGYNGLDNAIPYFYYSQGCFAGDFLASDSIIEKMVYKRGGPFAAMANSHYGLGPEDPEPETTVTPGTSQILNRMFMNRAMGSELLAFGRAHQKSKEDITIYIEHEEARWVTWAAHYFGDPAFKH